MARTVEEVFYAHTGRQVDKWSHYFPIYQAHFAKYVDKPIKVLEIGVDHGGSLQLWEAYFGEAAQVIGIDIDPRCQSYASKPGNVIICDQADEDALYKRVIDRFGPFDIIIDDGSHVTSDQEASFNALWPWCRGVYLIEDCHSGYPQTPASDAIRFWYPWVVVIEKPKRVIRGTPSRPLRQDEINAQHLYSHP